LVVRDNKLKELPEELCECKALRELSVQTNELTLLPASLGARGWGPRHEAARSCRCGVVHRLLEPRRDAVVL
jgi:Leucine-rich repeat (LRR) protein